FAAGLVEEVEKLLEQYHSLSRTASQAVGYREVIEMLQQGTSLDATIERVTIRTRQFARRQETWFRSLSECRRIERAGVDDPMEIVEEMLSLAESVEPGTAG
ncbi:MAG: tRNA (adenosine(37)-N6)-dimethylallyltransferase MiaA, partial [Planctomycetaceae bacterium]|nr:tRNA (adenosine(37)-N6)-dimethylallyltransferase MiaA [Planctomycetaceae bacterium]